jgi:peptide/nickel transport system substrate-binding protein
VGDKSGDAAGAGRPGIKTFLIADVRGYTLFTQQRGDEAAAKLAARFAEIAREAVDDHGGSVIELRGDEALAVFDSPRQAIRAATRAQLRFVEETESDPSLPLAVGIGIDAGEAVPLEAGYRGGALNLAARLCGRAGPGEILASQAAVHLARKVEGVRYADQGDLHLKGLADPVRVFRVISEEADPAVRIRLLLPREPRGGPAPIRLARQHPIVAAIAAFALVAAIVVPTTLALQGGGPGERIAGDAMGIVDLDGGDLTGSVVLESRPGDVAVGEGSVWVTMPDRGEVVEIDPDARSIRDTIPVGTDPSGIAIGAGSVWVANGGNSTVSRISPDTNRVVQSISSPGGPAGIAVGHGGVWVANSTNDSVSHIDPETGEVVAVIGVGDRPVDLVVDQQGLWVANAASGDVTLVDPELDKASLRVDVGRGPHSIAGGLGGIWVSDFLDGTVSRIDPDTHAVTSVDVGGTPSGLAVGAGFVVVSDGSPGSVTMIDAISRSVAKIPLGSHASGVALDGGAAWVGVRGPEAAHRGGTLTVVAPAAVDSIDPALAYGGLSWSIVALGYDGLVGFKHVGGLDGGTVVPNLALSIPEPTEGGRTYTFQLREGIRYSNGENVEPQDFQRAIERVLAIEDASGQVSGGVPYFSGIVGADRCELGRPCDLSRGVVSDDARGTVTFHLVEPDPDFVYGLGLPFASPVPAGTPDTSETTATTTIPTTGPYAIERYTEDEELLLVRNREFRERPARPGGFADRIVWRFISDLDRQVEEVLGDRADLTWQLTGRVAELATSEAGQVYLAPSGGVFYMSLNMQTPPFDDVRVRRAVNLAVDRDAVAALFGGGGVPACQILPPAFPGYLPECPYTRHPGPTWTAPDLAKAKELVARSGTADARVAVWASREALPLLPLVPVGRYFVALLNDLGYRATLNVVAEEEYFGAIFDPSGDAQMGFVGWGSDYPAESGFLPPVFTCGSPSNVAHFCDRGIERRMEEATNLQLIDPLAAHDLWASIEHDIVDLAPWVPLVNPPTATLVSKRLGNYQLNPQWGPLFDQMWVR